MGNVPKSSVYSRPKLRMVCSFGALFRWRSYRMIRINSEMHSSSLMIVINREEMSKWSCGQIFLLWHCEQKPAHPLNSFLLWALLQSLCSTVLQSLPAQTFWIHTRCFDTPRGFCRHESDDLHNVTLQLFFFKVKLVHPLVMHQEKVFFCISSGTFAPIWLMESFKNEKKLSCTSVEKWNNLEAMQYVNTNGNIWIILKTCLVKNQMDFKPWLFQSAPHLAALQICDGL